MKLYKVLGESGDSCHGGNGTWPLPENGRPGEWVEVVGELEPCQNGLHLCRREDLVHWLGPTIYEAEHEGELIEDDNKVVVRKARLIRRLETWSDRTARLFACDCAERALEVVDNPDPRSIEVVRIARLYAIGEASKKELAAAWAAAWDAAGAAARAAAGDAAWDAARDAAWDAAGAAARAAARAAAWAAAGAAAGAAARAAAWAAAWAAARAAAWAAAWDAARDAAWDAAGAAARAAARAAAWDAAWEWQTEKLFQYLESEGE